MIAIDFELTPAGLAARSGRFWSLSADKIRAIEGTFDPGKGSPVFTVGGLYTARGWTEWTEGFRYGSAILQYDATGEPEFLALGRRATIERMARHVSHHGVHDHGFNNVSTYGNLLRLAREGRTDAGEWERRYYELALTLSAANQAWRWTPIRDGGFIYSFNGPHSLFVDTIRSLRVLAIGHQLGHVLMGEGDRKISLLGRLVHHAATTAKYAIYYGEGRDGYDVRGRTAHESIFNVHDGSYRCPSTQQGYSPFSTWTRGLAWALCGFAEELEFIRQVPDRELEPFGGRVEVEGFMLRAARATGDFYIEQTPPDGIPYWDTGAPGLPADWREHSGDPWNAPEPLDSSAAAIASQGLLRLAEVLESGGGDAAAARRYRQAGLTVLRTLLDEPYLSEDPRHQGLVLHSIYHRPRAWDSVPPGRTSPCGESSMWGDFHAREAVLYVDRLRENRPYLKFFSTMSD